MFPAALYALCAFVSSAIFYRETYGDDWTENERGEAATFTALFGVAWPVAWLTLGAVRLWHRLADE